MTLSCHIKMSNMWFNLWFLIVIVEEGVWKSKIPIFLNCFSNISSSFGKVDIAQKLKFSFKDFFSKCDQIRSFTEEILNGKLHFLCRWRVGSASRNWVRQISKVVKTLTRCILPVQIWFLRALHNLFFRRFQDSIIIENKVNFFFVNFTKLPFSIWRTFYNK